MQLRWILWVSSDFVPYVWKNTRVTTVYTNLQLEVQQHGSVWKWWIWVNYNDPTVLTQWNHGFYREIIPKWPQDSGYWTIIILPIYIYSNHSFIPLSYPQGCPRSARILHGQNGWSTMDFGVPLQSAKVIQIWLYHSYIYRLEANSLEFIASFWEASISWSVRGFKYG